MTDQILDKNQKLKLSSDRRTDPDILAILSNDEDPEIRFNVACNPSTKEYITKILLVDKDVRIKRAVVSHITDVSLLRFLFDTDGSLKEDILYNKVFRRHVMTKDDYNRYNF